MTALPPAFLTTPLAHRGYHDRALGRIENSAAAITAAIGAGYGIEIDVQLSADGAAMVFHDAALDRLTDATGRVDAHSAAALRQIRLEDSDETIPTLPEILERVAGRVPLLIEIKDQDGALGPGIGPLEAAVASAAGRYRGPLAVMSFNPHSVTLMARLAATIPRGLTTAAFDAATWPRLPEARRARLREIADLDACGASFVSHEAGDLDRPRIAELRAGGLPVLCWTIRSPAEEARARRFADNITFEGYAPDLPSS